MTGKADMSWEKETALNSKRERPVGPALRALFDLHVPFAPKTPYMPDIPLPVDNGRFRVMDAQG